MHSFTRRECSSSVWRFGLSFSFFLLIPLFMVCGPEGETGDVVAIYRKFRGHKPAQGDNALPTTQGGATRSSPPDMPAVQPMPVAQPVGQSSPDMPVAVPVAVPAAQPVPAAVAVAHA